MLVCSERGGDGVVLSEDEGVFQIDSTIIKGALKDLNGDMGLYDAGLEMDAASHELL